MPTHAAAMDTPAGPSGQIAPPSPSTVAASAPMAPAAAWSGTPHHSRPACRARAERIGADLRAKYVAFKTADDYPSSIDMATALHPQTLLATKYAREDLADPFGYPLRLRMSTKLGFKQPKWITAIEVTNTYSGGYWENLGFNWFSGI